MRGCRVPGMNRLRDCYPNVEALANVINRSRRYTLDRLTFKKPFTEREKRIILSDLGEGFTDDIFN